MYLNSHMAWRTEGWTVWEPLSRVKNQRHTSTFRTKPQQETGKVWGTAKILRRTLCRGFKHWGIKERDCLQKVVMMTILYISSLCLGIYLCLESVQHWFLMMLVVKCVLEEEDNKIRLQNKHFLGPISPV